MKRTVVWWGVVAALVLAAFAAGRASDRDETTLTVHVSSADHETQEGYFSLGPTATMMVKPGSEAYSFLVRQRGHKVKITMTEDAGATLSRLERGGGR